MMTKSNNARERRFDRDLRPTEPTTRRDAAPETPSTDADESEELRRLREYLTRPVTGAELTAKRKSPRNSAVRAHIFGKVEKD